MLDPPNFWTGWSAQWQVKALQLTHRRGCGMWLGTWDFDGFGLFWINLCLTWVKIMFRTGLSSFWVYENKLTNDWKLLRFRQTLFGQAAALALDCSCWCLAAGHSAASHWQPDSAQQQLAGGAGARYGPMGCTSAVGRTLPWRHWNMKVVGRGILYIHITSYNYITMPKWTNCSS